MRYVPAIGAILLLVAATVAAVVLFLGATQ